MPRTILVTGGAGYVGSVLVPKLLNAGHRVRVLDLYLYGDHVLAPWAGQALEQVKGDLRDGAAVRRAVQGCDAVIHLACISNDPSCDLDPALTKSVNYDAFLGLLAACRDAQVERFIFASSSSVYGISDSPDVTEDHPRVPVSEYNRYKALCEDALAQFDAPGLHWVVIRPATICGYSPRQRLDLTVNILTNHAVNAGKITVFGGDQMRPNIHIEDITDLYVQLLELPAARIAGRTYNAAYDNHRVSELAGIVRGVVQEACGAERPIEIVTTPSDDPRSYHVSSERIRRELGFTPKRTIADGVRDLLAAFQEGRLPDSMTDKRYFNIKLMQAIGLK